MDYVWNLLVVYVPPIIGVLVLLFLAWLVSGWLGRLVTRKLSATKMEATLARFLGRLTRWGLMVLAVIACLGVFGVETTSFAAVLGAAVLAIGLALQGTLSNLAGGVMLLIFHPFGEGDFIKVEGQLGTVAEISLFTTEMDSVDNRRIIVPNGKVFGSIIENYSFHDTRRVDVSVGTEYPADLDRAREVLTRAAAGVETVLDDPAPQIVLLGLGDSSIDWQLRVWTKSADYWVTLDATTRAAKVALDDAGIGIPFPQMDVHMEKAGA